MRHSRQATLFWFLFAVQLAGAEVIYWEALPLYRRLLRDRHESATPHELLVGAFVIVVMQTAYWSARRIQGCLRFPRSVFCGHVLLWISELSFFFPHALAALVLFDRLGGPRVPLWKLLYFATFLFAAYCFKRQLETLGNAIIAMEGGEVDAAAPAST